MPMGYDGKETDKDKQTPAGERGRVQQPGAAPPPMRDTRMDPSAYQRTFQTPQAPGAATPGQQAPMPWSGMNPSMPGGGSTPWAQSMQPAAAAAPGGGSSQAMGGNELGDGQMLKQLPGQGGGGMAPNWQALAQRFGGGGNQQAALPFMGGAQMGGGAQNSPWLQNLMQGLAQRFAALRAGGPQGGAGSMNPQQRPGFWSGTPRM